MNKLFIERFPDAFPIGESGKPAADHIAALVEMSQDPSRTPKGVTLRSLGRGESVGESRYMIELYLKERGDASIKTMKDLAEKSKALTDTRPDSGKQRARRGRR